MKNKVKNKILVYAIYLIIGVLMWVIGTVTKKYMLQYFSLGFEVVGAAKIIQYVRLMGSPEMMKKWEISCNDERNIAIALKARSLAFDVFSIMGGVFIIGFYLADHVFAGQMIAYILCFMIVIYRICYYIVSKTN